MGITSTDERSTLHGTGALVFGLLGLTCLVVAKWTGPGFSVIFGALGITIGGIGLGSKDAARVRCIVGIAAGAVAFLFPVVLLLLMFS
ncbi:hypothetical protein ABZW32_30340 [Streptomyces sp. NPDC004667]|uniref:hypothetical protein n=1 Tax=Streptomyces sp. NPDC004667 TaxID=3154285 RepID=UPI0033B9C104